jgi:phage replication-related protein YjqB (UPF0714/DUF867 family)
MNRYYNFHELSQHEIRGTDYSIKIHSRSSHVVVIAPHGGGIEPGTSEIAARIVSDDLGMYLFEGIKTKGNGQLHLTSTHFDEPECLKLIRTYRSVLTIHGCRSRSLAEEAVYVGGLHAQFRHLLTRHLENNGFHVLDDNQTKGTSPANICNKGTLGAGVQLEISEGLRRKMFRSFSSGGGKNPLLTLDELVYAIRSAIHALGR